MKTFDGSEEQIKEIEECFVLVLHFHNMCPVYTQDKVPIPLGLQYETLTKDEFYYRMIPYDREDKTATI